ncbi:putative cell cycle checkpoint protein [Rosellinia necatrix]|uniref:Putative cell cycle checkpoint protein n=1 Tax=Rosellinia necatrix TaxID=77044 RepID=A0A1W2THJ2_ROSNE|nr:putative cell cycle checkpoint protein [Rosellinia necatrix]
MPNIRFPKVKLGFLKKLLPKKTEAEVVSEPAVGVDISGQQAEKKKAALPEHPLEECPICHDPVGATNPEGILESWVHLHCKHKFGTHCIQTWLEESAERDPHSIPTCPICRTTARHPCGHPVTMPVPRLHPFAMWAMPPSPHHPSPPPTHGRRPRRRLSRRPGHPHRPPPPQPERARVQTVGECQACAAAQEKEKRLKEITTPGSDEVGGAAHGGRVRNGDRRNGIKSMLLQTSFRRPSWSTMEPARIDSYDTFLDTLNGRAGSNLPSPTAHLDYMNLCRTEITVARSPTPAPANNRILVGF